MAALIVFIALIAQAVALKEKEELLVQKLQSFVKTGSDCQGSIVRVGGHEFDVPATNVGQKCMAPCFSDVEGKKFDEDEFNCDEDANPENMRHWTCMAADESHPSGVWIQYSHCCAGYQNNVCKNSAPKTGGCSRTKFGVQAETNQGVISQTYIIPSLAEGEAHKELCFANSVVTEGSDVNRRMFTCEGGTLKHTHCCEGQQGNICNSAEEGACRAKSVSVGSQTFHIPAMGPGEATRKKCFSDSETKSDDEDYNMRKWTCVAGSAEYSHCCQGYGNRQITYDAEKGSC